MTHDRQVLVRATSLDELLQLAEIAADRLSTREPGDESLRDALKGATAEIRAHSLLEPA
jgi:hypothetical protein